MVAISIPIFTAQFEKAREATDKANIRSIYSQLSADVLAENTTVTGDSCTTATSYSVIKDSSTIAITGTAKHKMTQATAGTVIGGDVTIEGVKLTSDEFGLGTYPITIKDNGEKTTIVISK